MSYRYDEESETWVDDSMSSSEMTTASSASAVAIDDHKHDGAGADPRRHHQSFSPSAPPPPRSMSSSHNSTSTSSSIQSASSSSRPKAAAAGGGGKKGRRSRREWSDDDDDDDFEYVTGDDHRDEPGAGFPTANAAPSSTSRWFSPSTYISVPSGRGPQQQQQQQQQQQNSTSYRRDPSHDASISRCFREVFSCFGAIWRAIKQPFHQNIGLIFCFVASGSVLFGMGLIFASPGGVNTTPVVNCELGELGEGLYLTPSCSNFTEVLAETTCTWSCATGYDVAGGTAKRTCQEDGTWSGKPLSCEKEPEVMACTVPMAPAGASLEPSDECAKVNQEVPLLAACLWVCDGDLHSVGGNMQRECRANNTWSGEELECQVGGNEDDDEDDKQSEDNGVTSPQAPEVTDAPDGDATSSQAAPPETTKASAATDAPDDADNGNPDANKGQSPGDADGDATSDSGKAPAGDGDGDADGDNGDGDGDAGEGDNGGQEGKREKSPSDDQSDSKQRQRDEDDNEGRSSKADNSRAPASSDAAAGQEDTRETS